MNLPNDHLLPEAVVADVDGVEADLRAFASEHAGFLGDLLGSVLPNAGKRIRPALVFLSGRLGQAPPAALRTLAVVVEMIHIATLVHDDVIDQAVMRRGQPTVASGQGTDAAVLLGDFIFGAAIERAATLERTDIMGVLTRTVTEMCAGELSQIQARGRFDLTEAEYLAFIDKKTAALFGAAARTGGMLAGQTAEVVAAMEIFGRRLGLAFQMTDDILDLTGEEAVAGKTLRTDLRHGKLTLPLIRFRDSLQSDGEREALVTFLRKPDDGVTDLIHRMHTGRAFQSAKDSARRTLEAATAALDVFPAGDARAAFARIVDPRFWPVLD